MTVPLQRLGVVPRLFPEIVSGRKTFTIRWREAAVAPGPLLFVCDGDPGRTVAVTVTRTTEMPLSRVAAFVGREDEWTDDVLLEGMREHYPEIELCGVVQVIDFEKSE